SDYGSRAKPAIPALIRIIKQEASKRFPYAISAQGVLIRIGPACLPEVLSLLDDSKQDTEARARAYFVVDALCQAAKPLTPAERRLVIPVFLRLAEGKDAELQGYAVESFGKVAPGAKEVAPVLIKYLNEHTTPVERAAAAHSLFEVDPTNS